jgi:hypothetical protein
VGPKNSVTAATTTLPIANQLGQFAEKSELDQCHLPKSLHYSDDFSNADGLSAHEGVQGRSLLAIPSIENILGLHYRGFADTLR